MFPTITQRLMMLVGLLLVIWPAMWVGELVAGAAVSLAAGRWSAGVTLVVMVLGLLPAVVVGAVLSSTGNVLSGVWLVGAAAVAMGVSGGVSSVGAAGGGGMDAVVRASPTSGTMTWLALESGVWGLAVVGLWLGLKSVRPGLRGWLARRVGGRWVTPKPGGKREKGWADGRALGAGLVTAAVGGAVVWVALRSSGSGQVVAAGVVGMMVGGLAGRLALPGAHALLSLVAPAGLAMVGFWLAGQGLVGLRESEVLGLWHVGDWVPIARGLPLVLVGSGLVGVTMGLGLGQSVERAVERSKSGGEV
ncbi:MAG: hypothetical protein AAF750_02730 [Planctomycetota bacterium]